MEHPENPQDLPQRPLPDDLYERAWEADGTLRERERLDLVGTTLRIQTGYGLLDKGHSITLEHVQQVCADWATDPVDHEMLWVMAATLLGVCPPELTGPGLYLPGD